PKTSRELPRPSPERPASPHPWPLSEDYASTLALTPSPPTPPRPPTPGNWYQVRSTSRTRPPTPQQPLPPSSESPGSSPPSLRPPTPGAFLCPLTSRTTRMDSTTLRSPGANASSPSSTPPRNATSRRRLYISSRSPGIHPTSASERLPSFSSLSATPYCGTVGASGSPPETNCSFLTESVYCTTSRSPGGEPPLRATPTPPHRSSWDHQSPLDDQRPPVPPPQTKEQAHLGLADPTPVPGNKLSPPRSPRNEDQLATDHDDRAFPDSTSSYPADLPAFIATGLPHADELSEPALLPPHFSVPPECSELLEALDAPFGIPRALDVVLGPARPCAAVVDGVPTLALLQDRLSFPPSPLPSCRSRGLPPSPVPPGPPPSP
ncbi:unnamed protein product, partial [Ixodes persulcatus]